MIIRKTSKWKYRVINLINGKKYIHRSFMTTFWFLFIPVLVLEKYMPLSVEEFETEDEPVGYQEPVAKPSSVYNPKNDEGRKMSGEVEESFI